MDRVCLALGRIAIVTASLLLGGCAGTALSNGIPQTMQATTQAVCGDPAPGHARCFAIVRTDLGTSAGEFAREPEALRKISVVPLGLGPQDLETAYGFTSAGGGGQTIALIDAYDAPAAESDLAVYRSHFGLPPCTSINGCFRKIAQDGSTNLPIPNAQWATETAVDTQMAAGVCPNCHILLVEANSDSFADLALAVDRAAAAGATVISNSFGTHEWDGEQDYEQHWNHPGVVITASAGDVGYGAQYPAASQFVVAVGGTQLSRAANARGYAESIWPSTGSGCSRYISKPAWQHDTGCAGRTIADVAFTAGTQLPIIAYQSACATKVCGWTAFGGTSVSAPAMAGLFALAGNGAALHGASSLYTAAPGALTDISAGSDGSCGTYLCNAAAGFDGPSGLGSPYGLNAL